MSKIKFIKKWGNFFAGREYPKGMFKPLEIKFLQDQGYIENHKETVIIDITPVEKPVKKSRSKPKRED